MNIPNGTEIKYSFEGAKETYKVLYHRKLGGKYMYICQDSSGQKSTFTRSSILAALETGVFKI